MITDMDLSGFVDKSWHWTWDGYKIPNTHKPPADYRGEDMIMDETELMARGWYWVKIKPSESNSYTVADLAKTLSSNKFTPMDVYRALTMLWIRIEDMYPDGVRRH